MAEKAQTPGEMPRAYESASVEAKLYDFWMEKGYFTPKIEPDKKPFVIIHPPTNITGDMHLGTALVATLQDIMIRWHRMMGEPTLWLPGVDHAGIATQVVVERLIAEEGTDRHQLGREKFLERVWEWADTYRNNIVGQHKRLGASLDWTRLRFTMDEGPSRAVRTTFVRLYEKGLIYRGERIINWCPRCATALSDLETDHDDLTGHLWYIRYHLVGGDGSITVATTRPETILGDTAVAVNPEDERFKAMIGKKAILPAVNREIPIISDEAIDPAFGTGAVKITPAHDPVDFEVAQRHNLPLINILNLDITMNEQAGPYVGMDRFDCREAILADLEREGLLEKVEPYEHSVGHCQRCQTVIEPIASEQWFVKVAPLAKPAIEAVADGRINIIPSRFTKVYTNWMENIHDWCISRQLWWGHRIPAWYCRDCAEVIVVIDELDTCPKCESDNIEQDPDVLDTWFSSALWPYSTLGWPDDTEDLRYFYPTTVLETAYDILFFWVVRMIMMGLDGTGDIPFQTVYFHGLIRDEKGEKMTKTRGNVVNPVDVIEQYGTDALRFALITGSSPGNDSKLSPIKLEMGRNFANKLWNATRFVLRSIEATGAAREIEWGSLQMEDRWILSRLSQTVSGVNKAMADFQFAEAQRQIYDFLWSEFCDWYIELAKIRLRTTAEEVLMPLTVLVYVLETSLRLIHPYMPFLTEELWQNLKGHLSPDWQIGDSIMVAPYPEADANAIDPEAERVIESVIEIIRSIRNTRAQYSVDNARWVEAKVYGGRLAPAIAPYSQAIETLARARPVTIREVKEEGASTENTLVSVLSETEVVVPMESMVDAEAEMKRLEKEIEQGRTEVARLETRLENQDFLAKAPAPVVEKERQRCYALTDKLDRLEQQMSKYQGGEK
ncbi:MAG: valine--tRNA ligase [Dehalococcoidales bacterium]|jgi:valyl-tRNA synthetase|nr:valine--tRNA ligase [Dehalococcoidales bacterium]